MRGPFSRFGCPASKIGFRFEGRLFCFEGGLFGSKAGTVLRTLLRTSLPPFVPDVPHSPAADEERIRLSGGAQVASRLFEQLDPAVEMPAARLPVERWRSTGRPENRPVRSRAADQKSVIRDRWASHSCTCASNIGPSRSSMSTAIIDVYRAVLAGYVPHVEVTAPEFEDLFRMHTEGWMAAEVGAKGYYPSAR